MIRKALAVVFCFFLSSNLIFGAQAAVKSGSSCKKINQTSGSGSNKFTCKKVNNKLVWVSTPAASPMGSALNPIPMGESFRVGEFTYRIDSIEFGLDKEICENNSFNEGCTFDNNFNAIVDPNSTIYWAGVTLTATNKSSEIAKPGSLYIKTFSLVLPSGQLLGSDIFAFGGNDFSEVQVIPGGSGTGKIFFQIPKTIKSLKSILVIRDRSSLLDVKDYYFKLEW